MELPGEKRTSTYVFSCFLSNNNRCLSSYIELTYRFKYYIMLFVPFILTYGLHFINKFPALLVLKEGRR